MIDLNITDFLLPRRLCLKCGQERSISEFRKGLPDPRIKHKEAAAWCKPCQHSLRSRRSYAIRKQEGRTTQRKDALKRLYGLTPQQFEQMLEAQQNSCAICQDKFESTPHVDHCHTTKVVRGLLCSPCNRGLGNFKDSQTRLVRAIAYLQP